MISVKFKAIFLFVFSIVLFSNELIEDVYKYIDAVTYQDRNDKEKAADFVLAYLGIAEYLTTYEGRLPPAVLNTGISLNPLLHLKAALEVAINSGNSSLINMTTALVRRKYSNERLAPIMQLMLYAESLLEVEKTQEKTKKLAGKRHVREEQEQNRNPRPRGKKLPETTRAEIVDELSWAVLLCDKAVDAGRGRALALLVKLRDLLQKDDERTIQIRAKIMRVILRLEKELEAASQGRARNINIGRTERILQTLGTRLEAAQEQLEDAQIERLLKILENRLNELASINSGNQNQAGTPTSSAAAATQSGQGPQVNQTQTEGQQMMNVNRPSAWFGSSSH